MTPWASRAPRVVMVVEGEALRVGRIVGVLFMPVYTGEAGDFSHAPGWRTTRATRGLPAAQQQTDIVCNWAIHRQ